MLEDLSFFRGKRVLVTGHTGFKGTWLCHILHMAGAEVAGYALEPPTQPSAFELSGTDRLIRDHRGDIRDLEHLRQVFNRFQPEIVMHLAAQPIVRESYKNPRITYETNVMGTVNLLECVRECESVKSVLNVTTDKVYLNREWNWGYRENEALDGFDPYSNSKSCSEIITHSYVNSFFAPQGRSAVSTARAGNVIGGGDFAADRIIPDCIRAVQKGTIIGVRNPLSTRPYQHVLEPLFAYLDIVKEQVRCPQKAGWYNVGPDEANCINTGELVDLFVKAWGDGAAWENQAEANAPHEASFLKLDCSKIKYELGWHPVWDVERAVTETVRWTKAWMRGDDLQKEMEDEIRSYLVDMAK
ncbi:MAG: CDP-glucose 4,6-dehydratase [Clostridia bacterium]|nr:CDP-glucose 4,6-dehydratase [Clostridia bacterium]